MIICLRVSTTVDLTSGNIIHEFELALIIYSIAYFDGEFSIMRSRIGIFSIFKWLHLQNGWR